MSDFKKNFILKGLLTFACVIFLALPSFSQPRVMSWGNMQGIRVDGQLMEFRSSMVVISGDKQQWVQSFKERQRPKYRRIGNKQLIESTLSKFDFMETIEDLGEGKALLNTKFTSQIDTTITGAFCMIELPSANYLMGDMELADGTKTSLAIEEFDVEEQFRTFHSNKVKFNSPDRQLALSFDADTQFFVAINEYEGKTFINVYIPVLMGNIEKGQAGSRQIEFTATGKVDKAPVELKVDTSEPGRQFDGLGGNFRLQNPKADPQVIEYCLDNLNVTWSRVEMPWRQWHENEQVNPLEEARKGNIHPRVKAAMEMAKELDDRGIPVMIAVWFPPEWAVKYGDFEKSRENTSHGHALDQNVKQKIYESLTSYLVYLKEAYGVDITHFSFNESDLGIDVRQTAEEHTILIKELGALFAENGLITKMLLGDTADANGHDFLNNAMDDPATKPFIGAVSFHSWRGWEEETLDKWDQAAQRMEVPLVVGEGSIDASAWRVPAIFLESDYAMDEIDLYIRMLNICQPLTILQWQLTSDYSVLAGGGVFGNDSVALHPTQRFWNLKQMSSTPEGLNHYPASSDGKNISYAVLGDETTEKFAIHLVNYGASRDIIVTGLPASSKEFQVYLTNASNDMKTLKNVKVKNGKLSFKADSMSYISLISDN